MLDLDALVYRLRSLTAPKVGMLDVFVFMT